MSNSLLPPSASNFMRCAEAVGTRITDIPVDLNTLWSPDTCPVHLLPYLAWAFPLTAGIATGRKRQSDRLFVMHG
ncbi:phage tail protein I [Escherichia coli P0304777.8]|nr:phage tail protein I [Escherichia coli P0304777.8]